MIQKRNAHSKPKQHRMVFLEDLENHSLRETCLGAAEYAASCPDLDFEPWPLSGEGAGLPSLSDFRQADSLLLSERSRRAVFGPNGRIDIPHVFVLSDRPHRAPSVSTDEHLIGSMAAGHLIERGYPNLVTIGSSGSIWSQLRVKGFVEACKRRGVKVACHELPVKILPVFWHSNFLRRNSELVRIINAIGKPCGIFATNDVVACFLLKTARSLGIPIPHLMGIIGVDDDPVPNAAAGMLISSVQPPFRELGRQGAALLDRLRKGGRVPARTILPPIRVMVRTSTDTFMAGDKLVRQAQSYIEKNRHRPTRVGEVARLAGSTSVTLAKHFQRHLKILPFDYILLRRIEYSKELLREGRLHVGEIASLCGFHSASYFCKVFREITGNRPGNIQAKIP